MQKKLKEMEPRKKWNTTIKENQFQLISVEKPTLVDNVRQSLEQEFNGLGMAVPALGMVVLS